MWLSKQSPSPTNPIARCWNSWCWAGYMVIRAHSLVACQQQRHQRQLPDHNAAGPRPPCPVVQTSLQAPSSALASRPSPLFASFMKLVISTSQCLQPLVMQCLSAFSDVKPTNFCIGVTVALRRTLYLIDFRMA